MSFNYDRAAKTAQRLIANFGQTCTLIKKGAKSGPDHNPTYGADVAADIMAVDLSQRYMDRSGSLVGKTMRTLYVSTSAGVRPEKDDRILISGAEHAIGEVRPLSPAGIDVMWEVDLVT